MTTFSFANTAIGRSLVPGNYRVAGLTPQAKTVLNHMARAGSITLREAIADHSIQSLTRRISEIQAEGIVVKREPCKHPLTSQRYMRYSLVNPSKVAL